MTMYWIVSLNILAKKKKRKKLSLSCESENIIDKTYKLECETVGLQRQLIYSLFKIHLKINQSWGIPNLCQNSHNNNV